MDRTRVSWLIWVAVALGLLLRGYHYARGPVVWHDEAALLVNVIRLPVGESFGPLLRDEASPPLFLLLEKAVAAVLGDGEYALRLPSFLAACGSVVLTAFAARRMLPPVWAAVAVGLVAVSDRLLWHACEAKWYSLDVCVAAAAIWAVIATDRRPVWARCLVAAAVAPVWIWISFPACFVCGGVLVAWLPAAWRADWKGKAAFVAFALAVGISFTLLVIGPAKAQRTKPMEECWSAESGSFADWNRPTRVPLWAVGNSFDVTRYAFMPYGWPLLAPAVVGAWVLLRKPDGWGVVCTTLLPMGLVFVAACLQKYPFQAARTTAFLTPGLALLSSVGLRQFWSWFGPHRVWRWGLLVWVAVLLIPAGYTAYRVVQPWPRLQSREAAAVVLAERAADEPVFANYWEYDYLLRTLPRPLVRVSDPSGPGWDESVQEWVQARPPRIWLIYGDPEGTEFPYSIPDGYSLGRRWRFEELWVWELTR